MKSKSQAHQRLIEAARLAFLENGYHSVSAQQVYKACDLSQGSFSFAFPGGLPQLSAELWPCIREVIWAGVAEKLTLKARRDAQGVLKAAQAALVDNVESNRARARLYFEILDALASGSYGSRIVKALATGDAQLSAWLIAVSNNAIPAPSACQTRAFLFGPLLEAGRAWAIGWSAVSPRSLLPALENRPLFGRGRKAASNAAVISGDRHRDLLEGL